MQKTKFSDDLICYFEIYTRYSWVADKEQKKVLGVLNGSFLSSLLEGGIVILISLKKGSL